MNPRETLDHSLHFLGADASLLARFLPIMTQDDAVKMRAIARELNEMAEHATRSAAA